MMAERERNHSRPHMWLAGLTHDREGAASLSGLPGTLSTRSWDDIGRLYGQAFPPMADPILPTLCP